MAADIALAALGHLCLGPPETGSSSEKPTVRHVHRRPRIISDMARASQSWPTNDRISDMLYTR